MFLIFGLKEGCFSRRTISASVKYSSESISCITLRVSFSPLQSKTFQSSIHLLSESNIQYAKFLIPMSKESIIIIINHIVLFFKCINLQYIFFFYKLFQN